MRGRLGGNGSRAKRCAHGADQLDRRPAYPAGGPPGRASLDREFRRASIVSRPAGPHPRPLCALLPAQRPGQVSGAYRLHPFEWNIGEAAGALAAFCIADREPPRQVRREPKRLERYQAMLVARGVELDWDRLAEC